MIRELSPIRKVFVQLPLLANRRRLGLRYGLGYGFARWSFVIRRLPFGAQPPDDVVEDWRKEDAEDRHAQHAAEDRQPQCETHLRAGTLSQHQWNHAQNKRKRGHQNRSQT